MIHIDISNTTKCRINKKRIQEIASVASRELRIRKKIHLSFACVGDTEIKKMNHRYRHKSGVTDVLSFAYTESKDEYQGEILVAYPYIAKIAARNKISEQQEITMLCVHGILHVLGYDHEEPRQASQMHYIERNILSHFV